MMLGDVSFGRHPLWRHDLTTDAKWTITQLVCVMISVSKHISNVQYCLGTWVRNDSNPGSDMLPSHMKLIMIPVTLFNYPKWPFKFLFRVMRLEVNSTPKQLNCADILFWYLFWVLNYIPKCKNLQNIISWQPAHTFKSVLLNHEWTGQWSQIDMGKL